MRYQGQRIKGQHRDPGGRHHNVRLADGRDVKITAEKWQEMWDRENAKPFYRQSSTLVAAVIVVLGLIGLVIAFLLSGGGCTYGTCP
jgi:stalled ribosome rescue protein Dom34